MCQKYVEIEDATNRLNQFTISRCLLLLHRPQSSGVWFPHHPHISGYCCHSCTSLPLWLWLCVQYLCVKEQFPDSLVPGFLQCWCRHRHPFVFPFSLMNSEPLCEHHAMRLMFAYCASMHTHEHTHTHTGACTYTQIHNILTPTHTHSQTYSVSPTSALDWKEGRKTWSIFISSSIGIVFHCLFPERCPARQTRGWTQSRIITALETADTFLFWLSTEWKG